MNEFLMFITENYIWILTVIVILIITIIGFLADKNKSNKKVEIKESTPQTNDIPSFIHGGNVNGENTHEDKFTWNNMPPKNHEIKEDNIEETNLVDNQENTNNNLNQPLNLQENENNNVQTNLESQKMNNMVEPPVVPNQPINNYNNMQNPMNQPEQPTNMLQQGMNNMNVPPVMQRQNMGPINNYNNVQPQQPVMTQSMVNNVGTIPVSTPIMPNQMAGQRVENMEMRSTPTMHQQNMGSMNNYNNVQPQQPVMPQPMMNNVGTIPVPTPTMPNQMVNNYNNMQNSMNPQNGQVVPTPVNNAPVHEPIKVSPIPGMTGSAVSFVNGPVNNNQNQQ